MQLKALDRLRAGLCEIAVPEGTEIGRVRSGGVRALVYSVGRQRPGW